MNRWSGRGDIRKMGRKVDETRFSGVESWKNSTPPYRESPWRRLDHSCVISNGIRWLSPTHRPIPPENILSTQYLQLETQISPLPLNQFPRSQLRQDLLDKTFRTTYNTYPDSKRLLRKNA